MIKSPESELFDGVTLTKNGKFKATVNGYTESQMRQAIKDALEEAADLCETFDATHPKYLAEAIRKLKEDV